MRLLIILILLISPLCVNAGDSERVELKNYLRELNKIERLIDKAKADSSQEGLYRFRYDRLERDLSKLKKGISDYLEAPKREPNILTEPVEPIVGNY